jgi:ribose transport system substrate-binding protein
VFAPIRFERIEEFAMKPVESRIGHRAVVFICAGLLAGCGQRVATTTAPATNSSPGSPSTSTSEPAKPATAYTVATPRKPPEGSPAKYVLITNGNSPFWDAVRIGMENAGKDLGVKVDLMVNDATDQGQMEKLRQIGTQNDIVGVGLSAVQAQAPGVADEMRKLQAKGVHVITVDSDVDRDLYPDARFAFVGTDNLVGGRELGACAKGLRPDGGSYVTFVGIKASQNAQERIGGFAEGAGEKFKDMDSMGDDVDEVRARENVRNAIRNHPGLNTLVGIWSYNAPAIVDVVKELDRRKDFTVVTFDAEPGAIKAMAAGNIDAMVVQNPYEMGYQGTRLLKALVEGDGMLIGTMFPKLGQPGGNIYDTGLKVVAPDDGSPLNADLFGPKTQFMKLGAFREWLTKYGLEGS